MKNSHCEFFDIINFIFFCNEETKVRVRFTEFLELRSNRSDIEFFIKFSTAIFKGLVMKENYI